MDYISSYIYIHAYLFSYIELLGFPTGQHAHSPFLYVYVGLQGLQRSLDMDTVVVVAIELHSHDYRHHWVVLIYVLDLLVYGK